MALKLNQRELTTLTLRYELPGFLAEEDECFIEIDARPGGAVNRKYVAKGEELLLKYQISEKELDRIDDPAKAVRQGYKEAKKLVRDKFSIMYDTCVIEWRTNIVNDGKLLETSRENFLALAEEPVPEIAEAFVEMEKAIVGAGDKVSEGDDEISKN